MSRRAPGALGSDPEPNTSLQQTGWEIHQQVGFARYRIDLGIVDPEAPGRYLLGIEYDGANYHRAKTAHDRDKLRDGILRDLEWELHRIWSTDWWMNPEQEVRKLGPALERAGQKRHDRPTAPLDPEVSRENVPRSSRHRGPRGAFSHSIRRPQRLLSPTLRFRRRTL